MNSRHTLFRVVLSCTAALAAGSQHGCRDSPTGPAELVGKNVSESINAPGDADAPEIIFLAPLGPKRHPRGVLDTTLAPSIAICRLNGEVCGADTLAHFSSDSNADSTHRIALSERAYSFRWKLKGLPADPAIAYRVVVTLGDTTVGFTDLKIVAPDYSASPSDTAQFAFITERNALNIRFQIFVPPVSLTVIVEPGIRGDLTSQTYSFRRGDRVTYTFAADPGYKNALVTLDQNPIARHGRIAMDDSHVLIASADRETGVARGDEWILRDARALLKAGNKVASAQQLLTKLNDMGDTVDIIDRLRRVEMTLLRSDADAAAMAGLDAALAGHSFQAGDGTGSRDDLPGNEGGGGVATALLVPLGSSHAQLRPSASIMTPLASGAEPVTIAYVNGILTTPLGALFAAHHVARAARDAHWNANASFDVKLMYNRSAMASETSVEDRCILDLGITGDWLGLNSLPEEVAKCLNSTQPRALALLADFAEVGKEFSSVLSRSIVTRPIDVDSVAAFTTRIRDDGRHVVFVMHSQGNLIVQQALALLAKRGQYSQARDTTCIGGVALASPTSEAWPISARHLNGLAVEGDAILMLGHNKFPRVRTPMSDSAAQATGGSIAARIRGLSTAASIRWGLRLHSAVESYLTQEPIRSRIQDAIVSSYRGCGLGDVGVTPAAMALRTGEVGSFHVTLADMKGDPLDGRRGLAWYAESESDQQRSVQFSAEGVATARYVGQTEVSAQTRNVLGRAGVVVSPAALRASAEETLSARWVLLWVSTTTEYPIPSFVIPDIGWDGGICAENATFTSNGRTGTFSKECTVDYRVTTDPFPGAAKYVATFFEKNATAALFSVTGATASLRGTNAGPEPNLDHLPGPVPMDRIGMTVFDVAGHLLARGNACVRGCVGWPPDH